jgi:YidC/Oxa1 family membrane protein insertase
MSSMQDNSNPVMKYMPYIFLYYCLEYSIIYPPLLHVLYGFKHDHFNPSNRDTEVYIIDHEKILAQIEINRKKPVKQSKLQERIQAMQEANKKVQDLKSKTKNRK